MSLNKNLYKYSFRCSSENKVVDCWRETPPAVCPNNTNHLIDLNSITITDSVIQNSVTIVQTTNKTNNNYRVQSKKITVPANTTSNFDYTWPYPIAVMTINWVALDANEGDVVNGYVAPNTTIGFATAAITSGETLIHVSPTVFAYLNIGYEVNVTDGVQNDYLGEVIALDSVNNTVMTELPASINMNAGCYVQMTIHNVKDFHLVPSVINLASKSISSSSLPANTVARLSYTNNSNVEKKFTFYYELFY